MYTAENNQKPELGSQRSDIRSQRPVFYFLSSVLCLLFSVLGQAQEPSASSSAEAQQDFWYRVDYKEEKIGYIHTVWESVISGNTPAWKISTDIVPTKAASDLPVNKITRVTYLQRNNFSFMEGTVQDLGGEEPVEISMRKAGDKIVFNYPAPTNQIEFAIPGDGIYSDEIISKWLVQQAPAAGKSYSIPVIYEERVSQPIIEINLKVTGKVKEKIMDKETECYLVECQYADKDCKLSIDPDGFLVKRTDGERVILRTTKDDAQAKRRDKFERNNRVDPFIPKYTPKKGVRPPTLFVPSKPILTRPSTGSELALVAMARDAGNLLVKLQEIKEDPDYPEDKREKALTDIFSQISGIRDRVAKSEFSQLKEKVAQIYKDAEDIFNLPELINNKAQYLRDKSKELFGRIKTDGKESLKTDDFGTLAKNDKEISELANRKEIEGSDFELKVKAMAREVKELNQRAEVIREFLSKPLKIGGTISYTKIEDVALAPPLRINFFGLSLDENLSFNRTRRISSVLINDEYYNENTKLDRIDKNLMLKTITEDNRLVFIYKGEEIIVNIKDKK